MQQETAPFVHLPGRMKSGMTNNMIHKVIVDPGNINTGFEANWNNLMVVVRLGKVLYY